MSDPFLGEIRMVGFNYAPADWALCNGAQVSVQQNNALFALLGVMYGGNGQTTFGLPDLQGRSPVGAGSGAGLTPIVQGSKNGAENITLTQANLPTHNHVATFAGQSSPVSGTPTTTVTVDVASTTASAMVPPAAGATTYLSATTAKAGLANVAFNGLYTGTAPDSTKAKLGGITAGTSLGAMSVTPTGTVTTAMAGTGLPAAIRNPYQGILFIIAMQGIFPPRP